MITGLIPTKLIGKYLPKQRLDEYFNTGSIEELVLYLRKLRREGYLNFDLRIKEDYFKWQLSKIDLKLHADVLNHPDPFGVLYRDEYGFNVRHTAATRVEPLNDKDAVKLATTLPAELAEKYIEIKVFDIDRESLKQLVPEHKNKKPKLGEASYKGLKIVDARVSYYDKPINMPFQEREVLRILIEQSESLVFYETFESRTDLADPSNSSSPRAAISKLISRIRLKLKRATDQDCIHNTPQEGWTLKID